MRQVILHPDREDGGWVAEVPSLPGCISQGETREEALANIREAMAEWLTAAADEGMPVPDDTLEVQLFAIEPAA